MEPNEAEQPKRLHLYEVDFWGLDFTWQTRFVEAANRHWAVDYVKANNFVKGIIRTRDKGPA